jgi:hypothetical protein
MSSKPNGRRPGRGRLKEWDKPRERTPRPDPRSILRSLTPRELALRGGTCVGRGSGGEFEIPREPPKDGPAY